MTIMRIMHSRNGRDVVEEIIHNWVERKTMAFHISFVTIRIWKLLGYEI